MRTEAADSDHIKRSPSWHNTENRHPFVKTRNEPPRCAIFFLVCGTARGTKRHDDANQMVTVSSSDQLPNIPMP
jgi:hypothetical protein